MSEPLQIAVTGMGVVCSVAGSVSELEASLRNGISGIGLLPPELEQAAGLPGAMLPPYRLKQWMEGHLERGGTPPLLARYAKRATPSMQAALLSAWEAWVQAGLDQRPLAPDRIGLIVAGSNLSQRSQFETFLKFTKAPEYLSPGYALNYLDTDYVGTLSEVFGIRGEGFTVGGASASGNVALIKGLQLLRSGMLDACLVVGAMADLSPVELSAFSGIGALGGTARFGHCPQQASRPFDRDHEGFIYGQGSGSILLETVHSAAKREVTVLAELAGGRMVLHGTRSSDPSVEGEVRAMRLALEDAGTFPEQIQYVNAHGTSTPLGDRTECQALREIFDQGIRSVPVNSTKGWIGHCLYSASIVEAIAVILQMRGGFIHPNANLQHPVDAEIHFSGSSTVTAEIQAAMSNAFGFGGINTSIILRREVERA